MAEKRRCANCMAELPEEGRQCLVCGFDNQNIEQPEYALQCNSVLRGRYLIGKILGQGGFGLTYIAWDQVLKVKVVVKEYFPMGMVTRGQGLSTAVLWNQSQSSVSQRQQGYNSFLKEAQKMARVDQIPSIVRVRDTFLDNETAYIIMDYVEGRTLKQQLLKSGPMAFDKCLALLRPMMEGLSKVHGQGIIHRDISPDNIMIQTDGSVKLLDLGAAKDMTDVGGQKSQLVAKKGFSPLEQYVDNGKIGAWTDVYALCATMYYCIAGKLLPAALERMDNEEVVFPDALKNALPEHVINALKDGLALKPENRIQSVEELLQRFDAGRQDEAPAAPDAPKKKKKWLKRAACFAGGFFLVCVIGIFALYSIGSSGKKVKYLGNTNANMENGGGCAAIDKKYMYFTGADDGLYLSVYDSQADQFNLDSCEKICDYGKYINIGKEYVYFEGKEDGKSVIFQMNLDGTGLEKICGGKEQKSCVRPQYAEFASGREYIYYMLEKEQGASLNELYRYDVREKTDELLTDKNVFWYNIYKDSIYMIAMENQNNVLLRSDLSVISQETLDEENMYEAGFVEDDTMFLYSLKNNKLAVCNLDGEEQSGGSDWFNGAGARGYGGGWLYYEDLEKGTLCRAQTGGENESVVMENFTAGQLCYAADSLWIMTEAEQSDVSYRQLFMAKGDGSDLTGVSKSVSSQEFETADEADFTCEDSENGNGVAITGYNGSLKEFMIPAQIGGKQVKEIKGEAFKNADIERISFPEGMEKIGFRAFYGCVNLSSAVFPESLKEIEGQAFAVTDLASVYIPAGVEAIGNGVFLNRVSSGEKDVKLDGFEVSADNPDFTVEEGVLFQKLKDGGTCLLAYPQGKEGASYAIPDYVTEIGSYSFGGTNLEEITIPSSVQKISERAFYAAGGLKSITVPESCELPNAFGVALRVNFSDMETEDEAAFTYEDNESGDGVVITKYTGEKKSFAVPGKLGGKQVKEIGNDAFSGSGVVKAYLPDGLEIIESNAFAHCFDLEFVSFPESIKIIGSMAFLNTNLISAPILSNVETVGYGAFLLRTDAGANNRLKNFEVSGENASFVEKEGVLYQKADAGGQMRLIAYPQGRDDEAYQIPEDVVELWFYCFARSKLKSVDIPSSVKRVLKYAFATCSGLDYILVGEDCEVQEQGDDVDLEIKRY